MVRQAGGVPANFGIKKKSNYTVHPDPYAVDVPGFWDFSFNKLVVAWASVPAAIVYAAELSPLAYVPVLVATLIPVFGVYMWLHSLSVSRSSPSKGPGLRPADYLTFKDSALARSYSDNRIPMVSPKLISIIVVHELKFI